VVQQLAQHRAVLQLLAQVVVVPRQRPRDLLGPFKHRLPVERMLLGVLT
jgi:hypothetical protein